MTELDQYRRIHLALIDILDSMESMLKTIRKALETNERGTSTLVSIGMMTTMLLLFLFSPPRINIAYAQWQTFEEPNENLQAYITKAIEEVQNKPPDRTVVYYDSEFLIVYWTTTINATAPDGRVFSIEEETQFQMPHNFTASNGYTYRDGIIYKPDGTEIFSD